MILGLNNIKDPIYIYDPTLFNLQTTCITFQLFTASQILCTAQKWLPVLLAVWIDLHPVKGYLTLRDVHVMQATSGVDMNVSQPVNVDVIVQTDIIYL